MKEAEDPTRDLFRCSQLSTDSSWTIWYISDGTSRVFSFAAIYLFHVLLGLNAM